MGDEWQHPTLGIFRFTFHHWEGTVRVPAFESFSFRRDADRKPDRCGLSFSKPMFGPAKNSDPPSAAAIDRAEHLIANASRLVPAISKALWNEFHGRGSRSGMWWRNEHARVLTSVHPPVDRLEDVTRLLGDPTIVVFDADPKLLPRFTSILPQITFAAAFEREHGLAVLTNGAKVLGVGYMSDGASRYKR